MSSVVPEFPELAGLHDEAADVLRSAASGDTDAAGRLAAAAPHEGFAAAQQVVAGRYGFATWSLLEREVDRKTKIHHADVDGLRQLVARHPEMAARPVSSCFENDGPLGYVGVAGFHGLTDPARVGALARALLAGGCPPNGPQGTPETPLITAASYGEADMASALIEAGADLEATGSAVAGGTALSHAVAFGNRDIVDILAAAGAVVHDVIEAAGTGALGGFPDPDSPPLTVARALRAAAVCERLAVLDEIIGTGLPVGTDLDTGAPDGSHTVLHEAAYAGKPAAVRHLLTLGADPNRRDPQHNSTPLGWCRHRHAELALFGTHLTAGHRQVESMLEPITAAV
jgi:hypothetical protein